MNGRSRLLRRLGTAALTCALLVAPATRARAQVAGSAPGGAGQEHKPSEAELAAARALFQEAYHDEQEHRFAAALEKFQRVAAVKESAAVRYRIAAVLGALGRMRESRDTFRALAISRGSLGGAELDIADSAAERAQALDRRIPRLVLRLDRSPPAGARVLIDGTPVSASIAPRRFELDPGEHVVSASAPSVVPFESRIAATENLETPLTVVLAPRGGRVTSVVPPAGAPGVAAPGSTGSTGKAFPIVAVVAGAALVTTSVVLLVLRENDIAAIDEACGDVCPNERRAALEAKRDEAELFGPLAVGFGVAGLALTGVGIYLLVRPDPASPQSGTTAPLRAASGPRGLRWNAHPIRDGAMMSLGAAF